ncbi:hypothetical protein RintRC_0780 [Richelia intracellularis]|nr:hypothetical protein RintRC_0780 [Richelia intracellularis]
MAWEWGNCCRNQEQVKQIFYDKTNADSPVGFTSSFPCRYNNSVFASICWDSFLERGEDKNY